MVYLNEERYFEALGLGRREVDDKEIRRYNRMAQGAEIKHNEKEKSMYTATFRKNMDLKRNVPINPKEGIEIDDEYLEGYKQTGNHIASDGFK